MLCLYSYDCSSLTYAPSLQKPSQHLTSLIPRMVLTNDPLPGAPRVRSFSSRNMCTEHMVTSLQRKIWQTGKISSWSFGNRLLRCSEPVPLLGADHDDYDFIISKYLHCTVGWSRVWFVFMGCNGASSIPCCEGCIGDEWTRRLHGIGVSDNSGSQVSIMHYSSISKKKWFITIHALHCGVYGDENGIFYNVHGLLYRCDRYISM